MRILTYFHCAAVAITMSLSNGLAHSKTIEVEGLFGKISIENVGRGDTTILFLHGWGGNRNIWKAQFNDNRLRRYRLLAMDLPGHGNSEPYPHHLYSYMDLAKDLRLVLQKLNVKDLVVVGHSKGASIALNFAGIYPERVRRLIAVDCMLSSWADLRKARQLANDIENNYEIVTDYFSKITETARPEIRKEVIDVLSQTDAQVMMGYNKLALNFYPQNAVAGYPGRILDIHTNMRHATPNALHRIIDPKRIESLEIPDSSHWIMGDQPRRLNDAILSFLQDSK